MRSSLIRQFVQLAFGFGLVACGPTPGPGGTGGTGGGGPGPACNGSGPKLSVPEDTTLRGPWPVGDRQVTVGRLTVEVLYPGQPGSQAGAQQASFTLGSWLPDSEKPKVPASENPVITADLFKNIPIDSAHGPYPVIFFVHGTGSFRLASYSMQALWASRGFIVVAADHPGLFLTDVIHQGCGQPAGAMDLNGDVDAEFQAVRSASGGMSFLAGQADMNRVGLGGHSQGAWTVAKMSTKPNVQIVLPLADTQPVSPSSTLRSVMIVAGTTDIVIPYAGGIGIANFLSPGDDTSAYNNSPSPPAIRKRLIGVQGGGHLMMTDLCQVNAAGRNAIQVAQTFGVCGLGLLPSVFDCGTLDRLTGIRIVNDVTTAALEETLYCTDGSARITNARSRYPQITDFHEAK